ncbi:zonular occludens toxin domain-containing protein [Pseudomonas alloputida]|uniref:zonular occludens toxin domain-containing protein n=1 Tax=Pseudomonas alloputida TaxID=1940621 RepID=UPI003B433285
MEFVLQGKKGNGKGIIGLKMIEDYLLSGRPVATNLNLFLEHLLPLESKTFVFRLPDQPSVYDMDVLGEIHTGGNESKNGLIVLDECASWLNSREYKDKERQKLLDWFLHSRKKGWDVVYIIQNINMLDKQFRDGFAEHLINVQRLDRLPIPFIGPLIRLMGFASRMPRIHIGTVRYGTSAQSPVVERIFARGKRFWKAYDTLQKFTPLNEYQGVSCQLSAWHVSGRYMSRWEMYKAVLAGSLASGLVTGVCLTFGVMNVMGYKAPDATVSKGPQISDAKIIGYYQSANQLIATLSDGRILGTTFFQKTPTGVTFTVGSETFQEQGK